MVAADPFEQMRADALDLIAADACERRRPGSIEVPLDRRLIKLAHSELGFVTIDRQNLAPTGDAES